jgi:hypothetical protein
MCVEGTFEPDSWADGYEGGQIATEHDIHSGFYAEHTASLTGDIEEAYAEHLVFSDDVDLQFERGWAAGTLTTLEQHGLLRVHLVH